MDAKDSIVSDATSFFILKCETKEIYHPDIYGISPVWADDRDFNYSSVFEIKEYQLYLKNLTVAAAREYPFINGVRPEPFYSEKGVETVQYDNIMAPIKFTGAVIIGSTLIKNYGFDGEIPCYSYKVVREFIFQDGKLVTTIDHSKAMLRIRKNLDSGLRNLNKARDLKCINHFLKFSFVGDYGQPEKTVLADKKKKRFSAYLQKMKSYYSRRKEL